jgi:hypothetical protein
MTAARPSDKAVVRLVKDTAEAVGERATETVG